VNNMEPHDPVTNKTSLLRGGCFVVKGDSILASDPAFVTDDGGLTISPVSTGMWSVYGIKEQDGADTYVRQLIAVHTSTSEVDETPEPNSLEDIEKFIWEKLYVIKRVAGENAINPGCEKDEFIVDSGRAGFFDACTVPNHQSCDNRAQDTMEWFQLWWDRVFEIVDSEYGFGITGDVRGPVGCVCASGYGDGIYPVEVVWNAGRDMITACRSCFFDPEAPS